MIRVAVMYPNKDGGTFDYDYYRNQHMNLVKDRLADWITGSGVNKGIGGMDGAPAPFMCIGQLFFENLDDFQAAFAAHGEELLADIPNYTNVEPVVQIDEAI